MDAHSLFKSLAERGEQLQQQLLVTANSPYQDKRLQPVGIEKAGKLAGVTAHHIRNLEERGKIRPILEKVGAGRKRQRRLYDLALIAKIREVSKREVKRPSGTSAMTITFQNQKGGVAKTSASVHFAQYAAMLGHQVLLCDLDPQGSATSVFGYVPDLDLTEEQTVLPALTTDPAAVFEAIRETYWHGLYLLPAMLDLQNADFELPVARNAATLGPNYLRLRSALALVKASTDIDIIVLDTPPSSGMLTFNALMATDYLITPITPGMYELTSSVAFFRMLEALFEKEMTLRRFNLLITRHRNTQEHVTNTSLILRSYGEFTLTNVMYETAEVQKAASDMLTVYEIERPRGSAETHRRARCILDAVNQEILTNVRALWDEDYAALASAPGEEETTA